MKICNCIRLKLYLSHTKLNTTLCASIFIASYFTTWLIQKLSKELKSVWEIYKCQFKFSFQHVHSRFK